MYFRIWSASHFTQSSKGRSDMNGLKVNPDWRYFWKKIKSQSNSNRLDNIHKQAPDSSLWFWNTLVWTGASSCENVKCDKEWMGVSSLTVIACCVAPKWDHWQEPMKESTLDVPEKSLIDQFERVECNEPDGVGRNAVQVVHSHENDPKNNDTQPHEKFQQMQTSAEITKTNQSVNTSLVIKNYTYTNTV